MKKVFRKEILIAVCVLSALAILVFGIDFLKGVNVFKATNYYYATYTDVQGLAVSAPVTLSGYKVGQVRDITYEYDNPGHVRVEIALDKNLRLPNISTVFAGFGMIIYLQNVGNFPTYTAHTQIGMFSIAALLVGGASVEKASIKNVFLGVILFHTMFIVAPRTGTVITGDSMIGEYFRVFVSYAVITIALVMYEAKKRKAKSAAGLQLAADQLAEEEAKAK